MASGIKPGGIFLLVIVVAGTLFAIGYFTGILDTITGGNVVRVAQPTYPGITGATFYNDGLDPNPNSRFTKDYGIDVQLTINDNLIAIRDQLLLDEIDVGLTTLDGLVPGIDEFSKYGIEIFGQTDISQGADVLTSVAQIETLKDLLTFEKRYGRKPRVGYQPDGPSMTALGNLLEAADIPWNTLEHKTQNSVPEVVDAMIAGTIDLGMVWAPDDQSVLKEVKNSHVLWSTKQGSQMLFGIMYATTEWLEKNPEKAHALLEGWMKANAELTASASARHQCAQLMSGIYGGELPVDFWESSYENVRLATYGDQVNFFGLNPSYTGMTADRIFLKAVKFYQEHDAVGSQVPAWRDISNTDVIQSIKLTGREHEAQRFQEFSPVTTELASKAPLSVKSIHVNFAVNSSKLDANAEAELDKYADILKMNRNARFRIDGHTDADGDRSYNIALSEKRGWAAADYFIEEYGFSRNQFIVAGHGPDMPIASNTTDEGKFLNRRTEIGIVIE